jgi:hypothetical protein
MEPTHIGLAEEKVNHMQWKRMSSGTITDWPAQHFTCKKEGRCEIQVVSIHLNNKKKVSNTFKNSHRLFTCTKTCSEFKITMIILGQSYPVKKIKKPDTCLNKVFQIIKSKFEKVLITKKCYRVEMKNKSLSWFHNCILRHKS